MMRSREEHGQRRSRMKMRKDDLRGLLRRRDLHEITSWAVNGRGALRALRMILYDMEPIIFWRAIEAMGRAAGIIAASDMDRIRRHIRGLLWLMNDESGGLCRRAPEAVSEILVHVPDLISEYAHLIPSYLWEEPFERGIRFGIYRLASMRPETRELFSSCIGDLVKSLEHDSESIRGYSLLALKSLRQELDRSGMALPDIAPATIPVYNFETGELRQITIGISDITDEQASLF
jgi:hypothetical protein